MQKLHSYLLNSLNSPWQPLPKVERQVQSLRICKRNDQIDPKTMRITLTPDESLKTSNNYLITLILYKNNNIVLQVPPFSPTSQKSCTYPNTDEIAKEIDQYTLEIQAYASSFIRSQEQKINYKIQLSELQRTNTLKTEVSSSSNNKKRLTVIF